MTKRQTRKVGKTSDPGVDAALDALGVTTKAAKRKYKAAVKAKAKHDGATFATLLRQLGLDKGASDAERGKLLQMFKRTLASMFHGSRRDGAEHSEELTRLAYRLALDPRKEVKGDLRRFVAKRVRGAWLIYEYPSARAALLPPPPGMVGRPYTVTFIVALLDCVLANERNLPRLRNLIVTFLNREPTGTDCLKGNEDEVTPKGLVIEINTAEETVRFCDATVTVPYTPFRILVRLCEANGQVVPDATLIRTVPFGPAPSTLRSHLSEIRKALRMAAAQSQDEALREQALATVNRLIEKKRGVGYRVCTPDLVRLV